MVLVFNNQAHCNYHHDKTDIEDTTLALPKKRESRKTRLSKFGRFGFLSESFRVMEKSTNFPKFVVTSKNGIQICLSLTRTIKSIKTRDVTCSQTSRREKM